MQKKNLWFTYWNIEKKLYSIKNCTGHKMGTNLEEKNESPSLRRLSDLIELFFQPSANYSTSIFFSYEFLMPCASWECVLMAGKQFYWGVKLWVLINCLVFLGWAHWNVAALWSWVFIKCLHRTRKFVRSVGYFFPVCGPKLTMLPLLAQRAEAPASALVLFWGACIVLLWMWLGESCFMQGAEREWGSCWTEKGNWVLRPSLPWKEWSSVQNKRFRCRINHFTIQLLAHNQRPWFVYAIFFLCMFFLSFFLAK